MRTTPVIKNARKGDAFMLGPEDVDSSYVMLFVEHAPGNSSPDHVHPWEHQAFITTGSGILVCGGKEYPIKQGDAVFVPRGIRHQFKNTGPVPMSRVKVNPRESAENK